MFTQTIREAIMDDSPLLKGYVYVVRDGDVIFYVGVSRDPAFRLCQHLGIADGWSTYTYPRDKFLYGLEKEPEAIARAGFRMSQVGRHILDNAPDSLAWAFDIYEQEDAIAVIERTEKARAFPLMLETMKINWYEQRTIVESELIQQLKPYLNNSLNTHGQSMPEKYRRKLNLDRNAVDFIHL